MQARGDFHHGYKVVGRLNLRKIRGTLTLRAGYIKAAYGIAFPTYRLAIYRISPLVWLDTSMVLFKHRHIIYEMAFSGTPTLCNSFSLRDDRAFSTCQLAGVHQELYLIRLSKRKNVNGSFNECSGDEKTLLRLNVCIDQDRGTVVSMFHEWVCYGLMGYQRIHGSFWIAFGGYPLVI